MIFATRHVFAAAESSSMDAIGERRGPRWPFLIGIPSMLMLRRAKNFDLRFIAFH